MIIKNTRFNIVMHIIDNFKAFTIYIMLKQFFQRLVRHTVSNSLRKSTNVQ